jgi:acyl-homoserine lactone acylase PvdQ
MNIVNDHDIRRSPDTSLGTCCTKAKFMLTLCRPPSRKRLGRCGVIAIFGMIMLALGCLRAPAQAAQASAPLELKRGQVTIFRDRWGMAHLYAAREEDGFSDLGYATAEDRLEQVLLLYLGVKGELAAAFGPGPIGVDKVGPMFGGEIPDTVASDLRVKKFQILEQARLNMAKIPAQYGLDLKAYIAGINQFMVDHPARKPAWAPVLEPAFPLALLWQFTLEADAICPARMAAAAQKVVYQPSPLTTSEGSDAFAIGRSRTADKGITFSSDTHHPWENVGTLFYPWRMKAGSLDVQAFDVAARQCFSSATPMTSPGAGLKDPVTQETVIESQP